MTEQKTFTKNQRVWLINQDRIIEKVVITIGKKQMTLNHPEWAKSYPDNPTMGAMHYSLRYDNAVFHTPQEAYAWHRPNLVNRIQKAKIALMNFECDTQERGWV